jgi:hypothetical protein
MALLPDVYELPSSRSPRPAMTVAVPPEPESRNTGIPFSHAASSGNLARLNRDMEQVRAEREMVTRLQELERREEELKEQIRQEHRRTGVE